MRLRALSLKYKFLITIVVFTMMLAVTFGFIVYDRLSQELWHQFYNRGEDLVKTFREEIQTLSSDLSVGNVVAATGKIGEVLKLLQQHLLQGEYVYFQLVINGVPIFKEGLNVPLLVEPLNTTFEVRNDLNVLRDEAVIDFKLALGCSGSSLESANLDWAACRDPSYLRLGLSPVQVKQELQQAVLLYVLITLAFVLVGVLVAFVLYKLVLGPVDVLTASVKRFRSDRYARANVRSGDELETLADEFNKMATTIARHERNLERINDELYRANQVKSEFLAVMGHELKTPLHAIRGYSQLLLQGVDGPLTAEQAQDLDSILSSGNHLLELIDNILRFSKLEAGEEPLHLERVNAAELCRQVLKNVESLVRKRELKLVDRTEPVWLEADETKLKQILINLVSNAIKYTPSGSITVRARRGEGPEGEGVQFEVADTGLGIAPGDAERVFEPFTQLDASTTRESSGIGLGLTIVTTYIEMPGGGIWLAPNREGGTVFFVRLPAAQTPQAAAAGNGRAVAARQEGFPR